VEGAGRKEGMEAVAAAGDTLRLTGKEPGRRRVTPSRATGLPRGAVVVAAAADPAGDPKEAAVPAGATRRTPERGAARRA
jgi:hypothetical protein